ncbi:hypothetical protein VE03_02007 [Pseudogymnoascus sp. 23342-1-I1]|nr:hypothetical protein VE03_02007 [Pseudogymnoascus sp. 23342-1-I1]
MMRPQFATPTSLRLLLFALYVLGTSAVFCDFYEDSFYDTNAVSNQEELDAYYAGCTEISGSVNIAANYTGDFYLHNVTTISGGIKTPSIYNSETGYDRPPVPLITSIKVPDLNDTRFIDFSGIPAVAWIWFPSLTVVNSSIDILGLGEDCYVDFGALTTTKSLVVSGNIDGLNFPLLADGGHMKITMDPIDERDDDYWNNYLRVDRVGHPASGISFPELQRASNIYLQGNIRSLSMPRLSKVGDEESDYYRFLRIRTHGDLLDLGLPNLSDIKDIAVAGTIRSISFHSLISIERFEVNTSTPLNVTLEPIQTISTLTLLGNVTEVSMSSVSQLSSIAIDSDYGGFYCSSIESEFERIKGRKLKSYECKGSIKSKMPLILGVSIGLGVPMFLAFVAYKVWRHRSRKKKLPVKDNKPPEYELGVPPVYTSEGLPSYIASEGERGSEQGAADAVGDRTGDASSVRGDGASEHSAGDAASARPGDGNSAHQAGASGSRVV